jgi:TolA-binding protein
MDTNIRNVCLVLALIVAGGSSVRARTAEQDYAAASGHYQTAEQDYAAASGHYQTALRTHSKTDWQQAANHLRSFLARHATHPLAAEASYYLAEALVNLGRFQEANRHYQEYLDQHTGRAGRYEPRARFRMGEIAYLAGNLQQARTLLEAFRDRFPNDPLTAYGLVYLGNMDLREHDGASAARSFQAALAHVDRVNMPRGREERLRDECQFGMARTHELQGKLGQARDVYALLASNQSRWLADRARYNAALLEYKEKDFAEVVRLLQSLEKEHPTSGVLTEARYLLGLAQIAQGNYRLAVESLRRGEPTESRHPLAPAIAFHTGEALRRAGEPTNAASYYQRVLETWPESQWADQSADRQLQFASAAAAAEEYGQATELLDQLSQCRIPDAIVPRALYLRGQLAARAGRWDEVIPAMHELAAKSTDASLCTRAEYWIAEAHYRQQQYAQANQHLIALAEKTRDQHEPWLAMIPLRQAHVLAQLGKWSEAYDVASEISDRFPTFRQQHEVDYLVGRCLAEQGRFDLARAAYQRVVSSRAAASSETAAMAQWMIGETYWQQQDYQNAMRAYLRVDTLFDYPYWQAAGLLEAGKCREVQCDYKAAFELYVRILNEFADTPFAEESSQRLRTARRQLGATASSESMPRGDASVVCSFAAGT